MNRRLAACFLLGQTLMAPSAWAGRPLATDDASTTEAGTCQLESWATRDRRERAFVWAPACGLAPGWEAGADFARPSPRDEVRAAAGLALKWAPDSAQLPTPAGDIRFGLKLASAFERPVDAGWRRGTLSLLGLATWQPAGDWAVHADLGAARERDSGRSATLFNLALVWTPAERLLLFAETQGNSRSDWLGGRLHTAGARWWLVKDRFGLDATAGRMRGSEAGTAWTLGFGWYGLGL